MQSRISSFASSRICKALSISFSPGGGLFSPGGGLFSPGGGLFVGLLSPGGGLFGFSLFTSEVFSEVVFIVLFMA